MTRAAAGQFDRRIRIEMCADVEDDSGDIVKKWPPDGGAVLHRWAKKKESRPVMVKDAQADAKQLLRTYDTLFTVRNDAQTRYIGPEVSRIVWQGRAYVIVGLADAEDREDTIGILCASTPDQRGANAPEGISGAT